MSNPSDFIIENGVLKKYTGPSGDVTIPEGVTSIGNEAFKYCSNLNAVFVPEGVTRIGSDAFRSCRDLKAIRLPASLNRIGENAFRECSELTQLDICDVTAWCAVTIANDYAHPLYESGRGNWRRNISGKSGSLLLRGEPVCELVIPEGVCEIAQSVFTNCGNIIAVSIPPSLKKIAPNVFYDCTQIKTVKLRDLSAWNRVVFEARPGFGNDYTAMCANPLYHGAALVLNGDAITELRLSGDLKAIGDYVFCGCGSLTSVTLEEGISTIGKLAFHNCCNLSSVTLPRSLKETGFDAFTDCKSLHTVCIEDMDAWLHMNQSFSGLLSNGADLLLQGEPVREVTIPEGLTKINSHAFDGCRGLMSVVIPDGVKSIGPYAFRNCSSLTCVTISESVTSIGDRAFDGCSNLTSVTIPSGVTSIGHDAFTGCKSLSSIVMSGGREITASSQGFGNPPFMRLKAEVIVPEWASWVTKLMANAEITAIHTEKISLVPSNIRALAALGFAMEEKHDLNTTRAAEHMAFLKKHAAKLCSQMMEHPEAVYFLCEQKLLPAAALDEYMKVATEHNNVELKARLLSYQNELGHGAVSKARAKKEKVKEEYEEALVERMAARDPSKGIEGLTFAITGKLSYAWKSKAEVKEYLESYGAKLSSSVTKQTDFLVATSEADCNSEKSRKALGYGALVISEEDFNDMVGWRFKDASHVEIPVWLREIQGQAFRNCKSLKSITIPDSVKRIGERAFHNAENVEFHCSKPMMKRLNDNFFKVDKDKVLKVYDGPRGGVTIPEGIAAISSSAFSRWDALTSLTIPESVKRIDDCAFEYCSNLTSVTIPDSVTSIGEQAFFGCDSLTSVTIPDSVTEIGSSAFRNCSSLTSVTIPKSLTSIGQWSFLGCLALADQRGFVIVNGILFEYTGTGRDVMIPAGVTCIGSEAFCGCSSLTGVMIPEGVTSIGRYAFNKCSSLTNVTIPSSVTEIGYMAFANCGNFTIHAPAGSFAEQCAKENNIPFVVEEE